MCSSNCRPPEIQGRSSFDRAGLRINAQLVGSKPKKLQTFKLLKERSKKRKTGSSANVNR